MTKHYLSYQNSIRAATQEKVRGFLGKCTVYISIGWCVRKMKVTPFLWKERACPTMQLANQLEDVSISISQQSKRKNGERKWNFEWTSIKSIRKQCSWKKSEDIIVKRYLEERRCMHYMLLIRNWNEYVAYRRVKAERFYKLAFALRLEVYEAGRNWMRMNQWILSSHTWSSSNTTNQRIF